MSIKTTLVVGIFLDPVGSNICSEFEKSPKEEFNDIKGLFKKFLGKRFTFIFKTSMNILELLNSPLDIFVVDYGGLLPGATDMIYSLMREINKYVKEHPSCLLVLWTPFTADYYNEVAEEAILGNKVDSVDNVIEMEISTEKTWEKISKWAENIE